MSQRGEQYSPTIQQVLAFMRNHPGEYFTPEDVCEQTDCATSQARMALETLARDGVVDKEQTAGGVEYAYRKR